MRRGRRRRAAAATRGPGAAAAAQGRRHCWWVCGGAQPFFPLTPQRQGDTRGRAREACEAAHREVDLLGRPEGRLRLLVHLPHLRMLDREEHEPLLVLHEERLLGVVRVHRLGGGLRHGGRLRAGRGRDALGRGGANPSGGQGRCTGKRLLRWTTRPAQTTADRREAGKCRRITERDLVLSCPRRRYGGCNKLAASVGQTDGDTTTVTQERRVQCTSMTTSMVYLCQT